MYEQRLGRYPAGEENGQRHFPQLLQPLQINLLPQALQEGMIREAKKGTYPANLTFEVADATALPYADASFDAVPLPMRCM